MLAQATKRYLPTLQICRATTRTIEIIETEQILPIMTKQKPLKTTKFSVTADLMIETIQPTPITFEKGSVSEEVFEGITRGNLIVQAIYAFASEKGTYPEEMEELIPNYLDYIPLTITNQEYSYVPLKYGSKVDDPFRLSFDCVRSSWIGCAYFKTLYNVDSTDWDNGWECGPKNPP